MHEGFHEVMGFHREERTPRISHTLEIAEGGNYFAAGLKLRTRRRQPPAPSRVYLSLQNELFVAAFQR